MNVFGTRLGDLIEDHCPRCRLFLNHAIASLVDGQVAKVICQTCFTEHPFRHGEGAKPKERKARGTLFEQVMAKAPPAKPPEPSPPPAAKKRAANPARYISRHKGKSPRRGC